MVISAAGTRNIGINTGAGAVVALSRRVVAEGLSVKRHLSRGLEKVRETCRSLGESISSEDSSKCKSPKVASFLSVVVGEK